MSDVPIKPSDKGIEVDVELEALANLERALRPISDDHKALERVLMWACDRYKVTD